MQKKNQVSKMAIGQDVVHELSCDEGLHGKCLY